MFGWWLAHATVSVIEKFINSSQRSRAIHHSLHALAININCRHCAVHHRCRQAWIHRHRAMSFTFHHILLQAWILRHRALVAVDRLSAVHHSRRQASHGALAVSAIHLHCVPADDMEYSRVARYEWMVWSRGSLFRTGCFCRMAY